jgi:hypothetical protein
MNGPVIFVHFFLNNQWVEPSSPEFDWFAIKRKFTQDSLVGVSTGKN